MNDDLISRKALLEKTETIYNVVDDVLTTASVVTRTDIVMAPAVDAVPRAEYEGLLKRFRHLLESDFISSFAEVETFTGQYKRDIAKADKVQPMRHARWKDSPVPYVLPRCSRCGEMGFKNWIACPHCGARMDEGGD